MNTPSFGGIDERVHDPDHLAVAVDQRTARVAGVHCRVDLDQARELRTVVGELVGAVQAGDDPRADGAVQAEGIADDEGLAPDLHAPGIAQDGRHDVGRGLSRLQDRDVVLGLRGLDRGRRLRPVGEGHLDGRRVGDHVQAGENVAAGVHDHATAQRAVRGGDAGARGGVPLGAALPPARAPRSGAARDPASGSGRARARRPGTPRCESAGPGVTRGQRRGRCSGSRPAGSAAAAPARARRRARRRSGRPRVPRRTERPDGVAS